MKVYVEGGGRGKDLRSKCRAGFGAFFKRAGLAGRMPSVIACGSRNEAFDDFCTALANGTDAVLLVDSEDSVIAQTSVDPKRWDSWAVLKNRDGWDVEQSLAKQSKRLGCQMVACDSNRAHLMVRCMEAWFLADVETLKSYFGQGFQESQLPNCPRTIENIERKDIFAKLSLATRKSKTKGEYGKGAHSFDILAMIDPKKVIVRSPWAKRLIDYLLASCN